MTDDDRRLGDRIIEYMETEVQRLRHQWTADGWRSENYSVAIEVNRIASDLGVSPLAINGALGHLHRDHRVMGLRVAREKDQPWIYAITLNDRGSDA